MKYNILIIEDEKNQAELLSEYLEGKGFNCFVAFRVSEARVKLEENRIDLVITDYRLPDGNGYEIIKEFKSFNPQLFFIVITAYGDIDIAVKCLKAGARDFLNKPVNIVELEELVYKILKNKMLVEEVDRLRRDIGIQYDPNQLCGTDKNFMLQIKKAVKLAQTDTTVLINGESGTGKELFANLLHYNSSRRDKSFIKVNCSAIPENLVESELFGYKKGSFSGAYKDKQGKFEAADGGTLFLDEIGELPIQVQGKLLRVIQEKEYDAIGSNVPVKTDVRLICATNKNLQEEIVNNNFREDLYYRINTVILNLPPLRKRKGDLNLLIRLFISKFNKKFNRKISELSSEALDVLMKYSWPGNVRELKNIIENVIVLLDEDQEIIYLRDFPENIINYKIKNDPFTEMKENIIKYLEHRRYNDECVDYSELMNSIDEIIMKWGMKEMDGVKSKLARFLKLDEKSIRYKLKKID